MHRAYSQTSDSVRLAVTVRLLSPLLSEVTADRCFSLSWSNVAHVGSSAYWDSFTKTVGLDLISMKYPETTNTTTAKTKVACIILL